MTDNKWVDLVFWLYTAAVALVGVAVGVLLCQL